MNKDHHRLLIKDKYKLSIDIDDNNVILYKGKSDAPEILNLFLEHYVTSALTDKEMIAKAIEKYQI